MRTLRALQPDLEALLALVTPVTDCVRDRALPVLKTPVEDGAALDRPAAVAGAAARMVGLASASQNFDGNGTAVRYMAGFGEQLFSTGQLPSIGRLQGLTQAPLEGARPRRRRQAAVPARRRVPPAEAGRASTRPRVGAPAAQPAPRSRAPTDACSRGRCAEVEREARR